MVGIFNPLQHGVPHLKFICKPDILEKTMEDLKEDQQERYGLLEPPLG